MSIEFIFSYTIVSIFTVGFCLGNDCIAVKNFFGKVLVISIFSLLWPMFWGIAIGNLLEKSARKK